MPTKRVFYAISSVLFNSILYEGDDSQDVVPSQIVQIYTLHLIGESQLWMALEFMDAGSLAMQVFDRPYVSPLSVIGFCGWCTHA